MQAYRFYEFFAGGGMVRAGLGPAWTCAFANDISPAKAEAYRANFGGEKLHVGDVHDVTAAMLPGRADLAWGSFPCQDLSLAGAKAGLSGARSGAFWGFMHAISALRGAERAPRILALENVCGALTSRGGRDFATIFEALHEAGYRSGALVIDAALFVPQSRPRLFIVAVDRSIKVPRQLLAPAPVSYSSPRALVEAVGKLDGPSRDDALWWSVAPPRANVPPLASVIEREPKGVAWREKQETERLIALMAPLHRARLESYLRSGRRHVGAVYRRIRPDGQGGKIQRAEIRFDGLAGCLRTPAGGSSRQEIVEVEGGRIRSRLLSAREAARLMGLDESYVLPARYTDAYRLAGDGVAVPVVRFLARELFEPLLARSVVTRLAG